MLAKTLHLGPQGVSVLWRIWAGFSMGVCFYLIYRANTRSVLLATALTLLTFADIRMFSKPVVYTIVTAIKLALGRADGYFTSDASLFPQWRIITPGVSFFGLLLYIWLIQRAVRQPSLGRIVAAGLALGLTFYDYFYFWTAIGLSLLILLAVDFRRWKVYLFTGIIGLLVGLPNVLHGMYIKNSTPSDWLIRTDNFLPIPRFSELLIPTGQILLLAVAFAWMLWRGRRDLLPLGCLAISGIILSNHQILTGLQIQNFHYAYVWAPASYLLLLILIADGLEARASWPVFARVVGVGFVVLFVSTGLYLRGLQVTRFQGSVALSEDAKAYRAMRIHPDAPDLVPNAVVAGDPKFITIAISLENLRPLIDYVLRFSPRIQNPEFNERIALSAYLAGVSREKFLTQYADPLTGKEWGPANRDPEYRQDVIDERTQAYDAIVANPGPWIRRFHVRYVARDSALPPPPRVDHGRFRTIQQGPEWTLWEYLDSQDDTPEP